MKKIITLVLAYSLIGIKSYAQTTIKIGSNSIETKGTIVSTTAMLPSKSEEDNRTKEVFYFFDGEQYVISIYTQTSDDNPTLSVYIYNSGIKLKPKITVIKSNKYRGGKAYMVTLNCNKKVCAKMNFYDAYTNGIANTLQDQSASIIFLSKVKADAFVAGINNLP